MSVESLETRRLLSFTYNAAARSLVVTGTAGDDTILIQAGAAVDSYRLSDNGVVTLFPAAGLEHVTVNGGGGADRLSGAPSAAFPGLYVLPLVLRGGDGNDTLVGNASGDTLTGEAGNDSLSGAQGDDVLDGGTGADFLDGGNDFTVDNPDFDTLNYATRSAALSLTTDGVANDGQAKEGDNIRNVEHIVCGSGNDTVRASAVGFLQVDGNGGSDDLRITAGEGELFGGSGNDTLSSTSTRGVQLFGDAGNDTLSGGTGGDRFDGGADFDTVTYANSTAAVLVSINTPAATNSANDGRTGEKDDVRGTIECVIGSAFNDSLVGSEAADSLVGGSGTDLIFGLGGNDTIDGGTAKDSLFGGNGVDWVTYAPRTAAVRVSLDGVANDGVTGENENVASDFENIKGSPFNDVLTGSNTANNLDGGAGDDSLYGLNGNDTLFGQEGNDWLFGGADRDLLSLGTGIDHAYGQAGNDTLYGNDGTAGDILDGGADTDSGRLDAGDSRISLEVLI